MLEKTIRITGKAKIFIPPNRTRVTITLMKQMEDYSSLMDFAVLSTDQLKYDIKQIGFNDNDLKTTYWNIDTYYEHYEDENKCRKRRFAGYEYEQNLQIDFEISDIRLGALLNSLTQNSICPEIKLSYYVDNVQEYKNTLLAEAVKDSKKKAEILVVALDKKLGEVINIDYSWGEVNIVRNREMPIAVPEFLKSGSARTPNITPNDIEISDTVTVLWQII